MSIATIFTWDRARLRAAQDGLAAQLRPAGISLYELNGDITLRPANSGGDDDTDRIAAHRVASDGMTVRHAEMLYDIMVGNLPTAPMVMAEDRLPFLRNLMNLGIVCHESKGGQHSHRLTAEVAYAFDV